uniref:Ig-like domain-containing protein n=1 Tax=Mesocestoides corti TaxID=53468 RepID=A0A5K3FU60_MESCO
MKGRLELWIAIFVLVFSFQGQAVLGQSWRDYVEYNRRFSRNNDENDDDFYGRAQPRTLEIRPMPSEDMATGMVVRRCQVVPTPPPHEQWEYTWSEPSGRIITSDSILSIRVTGEQPSVTYTCEARNPRTNDVLIGEFTVHARNIPTSS